MHSLGDGAEGDVGGVALDDGLLAEGHTVDEDAGGGGFRSRVSGGGEDGEKNHCVQEPSGNCAIPKLHWLVRSVGQSP